MKMNFYFLIFFLLVSSFVYSQGAIHKWEWVEEADSSGTQVVHDIAVDTVRGWVYAVGGFSDRLSDNFGSEGSYGGKDAFVTKFDTLGNFLWSFDIGGNDDDEFLGVDIDYNSGDIYVVGYGGNDGFSFKGVHGYVGSTVSNQVWGEKDIILARYDSSGELIWNSRDGGSGDDIGRDVIVDQAENKVAYTGEFIGEMELNTLVKNMGPDDGKPHMFIACRKKSNANGLWRAYSNNGVNGKGVSLTVDNGYFYLLGEYEEGFDVVTEIEVANHTYANFSTSSPINDGMATTGQNIFFGRFKKGDGSMTIPNQSASWLYSIYGEGSDFAGGINIKNNRLYLSGSVSNNVSFHNGGAEIGIIGNEGFVSVHDVTTGSTSSNDRFLLTNHTTLTKSIFSEVSFTDDYIVVGGNTNGTLSFDSNPFNNIVANGVSDGFVAFYKTDYSFVESHKILGSGNNRVFGLAPRGKDVFTCGIYGNAAGLGSDLTMNSQDNEAGFVTLLAHRDCNPDFSYSSAIVCQESQPIFVNSILDTLDVFNYTTSGSGTLFIDSLSGEINPFTSTPGVYNIIHETYTGCADTFLMTILSGSLPSFYSFPNDTTIYTSDSTCTAELSYSSPTTFPDCRGSDPISQIDNSSLVNGDEFPLGTTYQIFKVSDGYNPDFIDTLVINVVDTTKPKIDCPSDTLFYYTSSINECNFMVNIQLNASDNCGSTTLSQSSSDSYLNNSLVNVSTTPYQFNFIAIDNSGLSSTCPVNFYVIDSFPPVIQNCPQSGDTIIYLSANDGCGKKVDLLNITGVENCNSSLVSHSYLGLPLDTIFPIDTTLIQYISINQFNDSSACSFNVIVKDVIAPSFTSCQSSTDTLKFYSTDESCRELVTFNTPLAFDRCDFRVSHISGVHSGDSLNLGYHESNFIAIDSSGNFTNCQIKLVVLDTISPSIECPNDTTIIANIDSCGTVFYYDSIAVNDNCSLYHPSGSLYATQIDNTGYSSGSFFDVGTTTLEYQQQDISGQTTFCSFDISVITIDTAYFNTSTPSSICLDSEPLVLNDYIESTINGVFYGSSVLNDIYTPSNNSPDTVFYRIGGNGCEETIMQIINVHDFTSSIIGDTLLCGLENELEGNIVSNSVSTWIQVSNESYSSSLSNANNTVSVTEEGDYYFVWQVAKEECVKTDTIFVQFFETPIVDPGTSITVDESQVYLDATPTVGQGIWSIDGSEGVIENPNLYNTLVTELNLGLNTFQWMVSNGPCPSDSGIVRVFYSFLTIPNAFTPNGDGLNDFFEIEGFELYSDAKISILDRWGETIFISTSENPFWDGTYKGNNVAEDTYFYLMFVDGKEYTGYIELRR